MSESSLCNWFSSLYVHPSQTSAVMKAFFPGTESPGSSFAQCSDMRGQCASSSGQIGKRYNWSAYTPHRNLSSRFSYTPNTFRKSCRSWTSSFTAIFCTRLTVRCSCKFIPFVKGPCLWRCRFQSVLVQFAWPDFYLFRIFPIHWPPCTHFSQSFSSVTPSGKHIYRDLSPFRPVT